MEFRSARLDNGLEIVAESNPAAYSLGIGIFVKTGARDETDEVAGVSHFLEHMAFKGTPRRSAEDVNREFDEIGAHYNAFTSEESTVYYASVLPEYQEPCLDLLADIIRPSLRREDFNLEKKVILEEIQMYLDQPPYGMDDHLKLLCFGRHPVARSVLGTADSIAALTAEQMENYFEHRYRPGNLLVAAAGQMDFDRLVEQVAERCAAWQGSVPDRETPAVEVHEQFEVKPHLAATQEYILCLGAAPTAEDEDRFAAKLMATVVGDDSGSRMYWELVDPGLAESASFGHYEYQGLGMFYTWLSCEPDQAGDNLKRLREIFHTVEASGVTEQELEQAKNKVKSRVVLGSERPRSRLFNVGGNWSQRREYRAVTDDLASVDRLTVDDLSRVLKRYPLSKCAIVTVGPLESLV
ncbi:MAG: pitrilysin family protein [Pirellulales bacterium]